MDIFISKKMRNFILLAQTNNIARAAEKIHMTASPFGKSIAALEEQIGYTLFTRKDNNISLNKAGQELYQKLFPVYQRLSAIDNEIHNSGRRSREIVIGIDNTYPTIIFDQLISLGDKYEGVTAQPVEFSENGVIDNLFDRQLDFIISPQHVSARVQELEKRGIDEIWHAIIDFKTALTASGRLQQVRQQQSVEWLRKQTEEEVLNHLFANEDFDRYYRQTLLAVKNNTLSPRTGLRQLSEFIQTQYFD